MNIKMLVMDVDGTLTDGKIYMGLDGEVMKAFNVKDGYGIARILPDMEVIPVIITGRTSRIVESRARELHINELHQGIDDKLGKLKAIAERLEIKPDEIAYIGDDENDLECIRFAGIGAAPSDAEPEVKQQAEYICKRSGGEGAVREFIDYLKASESGK